ncbi:MAG: GNAT family N-acetyltransferase [Candidatus Heimdallarchaeota archaeon]|nr:GNAT family N-acetyltransferase [Candidatus Heimdallarchaeota archaeon]
MYTVELGKPEEYKDVDKILWRAFEIENKFDEEKREPGDWWSKEGLARSYIIRDNNKIVANMTLEQLPARIRGASITVIGIGAVATEPTHRRKKMIRSLFKTAFQSMKDRGEVFSMLDPFKIDYYRKFGYANSEVWKQYQFKPSNIISLIIPDNIDIREAKKGDEETLMDLQQSALQVGSRLYLIIETVEKRIKDNNCFIVEEDGKPAGWFKLYFHRDKVPIDWEDQKLTMTVSMTHFYNNYGILNAIFDFLKKFDDQVDLIRMNSPSDISLSTYIKDRNQLEVDSKGSMMVRIINLKQYIDVIQIPKSAKDSVVFALEDKHCPWNSGTYKLTPHDGKLSLIETNETIEIKLNDQLLSRIIGGLNSISDLQQIGIIDCTLDVAKKLESIFPQDTLMSYLRF